MQSPPLTVAQIAASFGLGVSTGVPQLYVRAVVDLLASQAPGLTSALRQSDALHVLVDGTLAE